MHLDIYWNDVFSIYNWKTRIEYGVIFPTITIFFSFFCSSLGLCIWVPLYYGIFRYLSLKDCFFDSWASIIDEKKENNPSCVWKSTFFFFVVNMLLEYASVIRRQNYFLPSQILSLEYRYYNQKKCCTYQNTWKEIIEYKRAVRLKKCYLFFFLSYSFSFLLCVMFKCLCEGLYQVLSFLDMPSLTLDDSVVSFFFISSTHSATCVYQ